MDRWKQKQTRNTSKIIAIPNRIDQLAENSNAAELTRCRGSVKILGSLWDDQDSERSWRSRAGIRYIHRIFEIRPGRRGRFDSVPIGLHGGGMDAGWDLRLDSAGFQQLSGIARMLM